MIDSKLNSSKEPLVSIGIPTYNRPDGLRHVLDCITRQTYSNLEIIVSDNASPGRETEQVVESFARHDTRIRHFRQKTNIGGENNFKFVLNESKGEYFAFFADDDSCDENFLAILVPCLANDPGIVLAMCDVIIHDDLNCTTREENLASIRLDKVQKNWPEVRKLFFAYPTTNIFFCIYGLYRTNVLKTCKMNFVSRWKKMIYNSEVPYLAQVATRGKIVSVPKLLKTYVSHSNSMYIKEMKRINRFDQWVRRLEVRASLLSIALQAELPLKERVGLFIHALIPANPC